MRHADKSKSCNEHFGIDFRLRLITLPPAFLQTALIIKIEKEKLLKKDEKRP